MAKLEVPCPRCGQTMRVATSFGSDGMHWSLVCDRLSCRVIGWLRSLVAVLR